MQSIKSLASKSSALNWVHLQQAAQYQQRIESSARPTLVIPCYLLGGTSK